MVDNCYGEFVERIEPSDVGADMVVGSLIKILAAVLRLLVDILLVRKNVLKMLHTDLLPWSWQGSGSFTWSFEGFLSGNIHGTDSCSQCA